MRRLLIAFLLLAPASAAERPRVYFTPESDFQQPLVKQLLKAKKTIDVAIYSFQATSKQNDPDYANLKKRGEITPLDAENNLLALPCSCQPSRL